MGLFPPVRPADAVPKDQFIGLVSCGKAKRPRPCKAGVLYTGGLTKMGIDWMARNCSRWYILSALYGLLHPDTVIEPYELKLDDLSKEDRAGWGGAVSISLAEEANPEGKDLLVLAGGEYLKNLPPQPGRVVPVFGGGMKMGLRMQWLKRNPVLTKALLSTMASA